MIVVADTTPLNYLVLIGVCELLPALYGGIVSPEAVLMELRASSAPARVREWATSPPSWLRAEMVDSSFLTDIALTLDPGEREAIALARQLHAALLVIDDQAGRREAHRWNLTATGTLGVLRTAAFRGLVHFRGALDRLQRTNFYISTDLLQQLLYENDSSG
jgi:predicted nucleic acid-binding protein